MANLTDIQTGVAQLVLQNVRLRPDLLLDTVRLEGVDISIKPPATPGGHTQITTGEVRFLASMSEPNVNRLIAANLPANSPVRNLSIEFFSGKAKISGQFQVSVLPVPFTLEATPRVENGSSVRLDVVNTKAFVFGLPSTAVEFLEQQINLRLNLDLSKTPFPLQLEEVYCEPGRLCAKGKARIIWPPANAPQPVRPFSTSETLPVGSAPAPRLEGSSASES